MALTKILLPHSLGNVAMPTDLDDDKLVDLEEELRDIVEDAQIKFPRVYFSQSLINKLVTDNIQPGAITKDSSPSNSGSDLSSLFSGLTSGNSGLGSLGGSGGLGALGGLGSLLGSGGMSSSLIPLLGNLGGLDSNMIKQATDIYKALADVYKLFKKGYDSLRKNSNNIVVMLTVIWILFTLRT